MELIDTHCHLTFRQLSSDVEGVLARSIAAGVTGWVTIATKPGELEKVVDLTRRYPNMYAGLGYHPHHAKEITEDDLGRLKEFAQNEKVVALGEMGLDYHYEYSEREIQKQVFRAQLDLAVELDLPAIVHTREAFDDTMDVLDEFAGKLNKVVIHCFSGDDRQVKVAIDRGYYISFTGIVTFRRNCEQAQAAVKSVPIDRLMVETDSPFISPDPVRNKKPCEPAFMVHTARKLAELKGMEFEDFARTATETSRRFFNLE